ncbi:hypothetical protein NDU88_004375 [Pleurodeles waltl]|uniref:Uncharacterized protein n=1 Tax=Pleurodeles waltl TaxID=8319 RepID=A0AAV7SIN1_PLEWA|nr:hypothetical protein NDU88_004375 [Pleurodeles waltl]
MCIPGAVHMHSWRYSVRIRERPRGLEWLRPVAALRRGRLIVSLPSARGVGTLFPEWNSMNPVLHRDFTRDDGTTPVSLMAVIIPYSSRLQAQTFGAISLPSINISLPVVKNSVPCK